MSDFKFRPWAEKDHEYYNPLVDKKYFRLWNHWFNWLGNWHEPLPYPRKRHEQAEKSKLSPWLWWTLRNPFHNLFHFWLGITPIGERYEWITPEENGWERVNVSEYLTLWKKPKRIPLPHLDINFFVFGKQYQFYAGWKSRGNLGFALRRRS